jgi:hypothetical protein
MEVRWTMSVAMSIACSTLSAGCLRQTSFQCSSDVDCVLGGAQGVCQGTSYCSFPDATCTSGQRYGDLSGPLAGQCSGATIDAGIDTGPACVVGSIDVCTSAPPSGPFVVSGTTTLDTDQDPMCQTLAQTGGPPACLIYAAGVTIEGGASLTAIGTRPLVIVSTAAVDISGLVDVSSRRGGQTGAGANAADCAAMRAPEPDLGGAGGGAGGSFAAAGGDGGEGDTDNSLGGDGTALPGLAGLPVTRPSFARGGCRGSDGADEPPGTGGPGGSSGGGVWIAAAGTITIAATGAIRATGAGGTGGQVQAGGGGGGSGGLVVLEAATISIAGQIAANSGSGGEGGARIGTAPVPGTSGNDGDLGTTAASGGAGASVAGDGGAGSAGAGAQGGAGQPSAVGGGGGGGGAGFVHLSGSQNVTGVVSPAPQ